MSTSERPAAPAAAAGNPHARFIPREELGGFAAWRPNPLSGAGGRVPLGAAAGAADASPQAQASLQAARQAGYQDGYRDGLAALESFKQSLALQAAARIEPLVASFDAAFQCLEADIADAVARTATALALQVVRSEVSQRPDLIARVAAEAIEAVLLSARHIRVYAHPDDVMLIEAGATEALQARQARLMADAGVSRGGCRVESDLGRVDASIETRWLEAAGALGQDLAYRPADGLIGGPS